MITRWDIPLAGKQSYDIRMTNKVIDNIELKKLRVKENTTNNLTQI